MPRSSQEGHQWYGVQGQHVETARDRQTVYPVRWTPERTRTETEQLDKAPPFCYANQIGSLVHHTIGPTTLPEEHTTSNILYVGRHIILHSSKARFVPGALISRDTDGKVGNCGDPPFMVPRQRATSYSSRSRPVGYFRGFGWT